METEMSEMSLGREGSAIAARSSFNLYRPAWRWNFYVGLLVLPFMITLVVTGALYSDKRAIGKLWLLGSIELLTPALEPVAGVWLLSVSR